MKALKNQKSSIQARKQRKARANASLHTKQKFVSAHLSSELRKKHSRRSIQLKKGDKVKVLRGQFKKKEDLVEKVDLKREKIYVKGVELVKKDGSKVAYPLNASNLMITSLELSDKKRKAKLSGKKTAKAEEKKEAPAKKAAEKKE